MTSADQLVVLTPAPPDEKFWRKYSREFEFPISLLSSLFLMSLAFGLLALFLILAVGPPREKRLPPMMMVDGGTGDSGEGMINAGGGPGDDKKAEATTPTPELAQTPDATPTALPDLKQQPTEAPSVESNSESSTATPDSFARLEEALQARLKEDNGKNGVRGPGDGTNGTNKGESGTGADATRARSLRWSMKFITSSGRDYLDQLNAMGAVVMVGVPPDKKQLMIFRDLKNPRPGTMATESDLARFSGQVQFYDTKRDSARDVGAALGLDFVPDSFWAIFPRGIEDEMARLERQHQNLRPEQIVQTRFKVEVSNGKYKLSVFEQVRK